MITIDAQFVGQPRAITDAKGTWHSSIFRAPVVGPLELGPRGLSGDQVTDTEHHGSPGQAVCCHFLEHYRFWNEAYNLAPEQQIGAGAVGENWALANADERDLCIGDVFHVGTALVQVSGPRYPCTKQERKLGLPQFHKRTLETMRTGVYMRVLQPGVVQAGDTLQLQERPHADLSAYVVNECAHRALDSALVERLLATPELADGWKRIFIILTRER